MANSAWTADGCRAVKDVVVSATKYAVAKHCYLSKAIYWHVDCEKIFNPSKYSQYYWLCKKCGATFWPNGDGIDIDLAVGKYPNGDALEV